MQNGQMKQTQLLSMFGLDQFKKVVVNSEFFLFARKKTNAENRPSFQMHDNTGHQPRRSTNKIRRSMTEENDQNQNAGYQRMPTYANVQKRDFKTPQTQVNDDDDLSDVSNADSNSQVGFDDPRYYKDGMEDDALDSQLKYGIGDIRVSYYFKTAKEASVLAQQWNTDKGYITFRPFNFEKLDASPYEQTIPTETQLKKD